MNKLASLASALMLTVASIGVTEVAGAAPDLDSASTHTSTTHTATPFTSPSTSGGSTDVVRVVVMLKTQPAAPSSVMENAYVAEQKTLISRWSKKYGLSVGNQSGYLVNGFQATMPSGKISELEKEPEVLSVGLERVYHPTEFSARELHNAHRAYEEFGVDGTGTVIAVIDDGINVDHPSMRLDDGVCDDSKLSADTERGFTCKIPAGYNYAESNFDVSSAAGHGMHVAGIAAANDSIGFTSDDYNATGHIDGVAPNAQVLAMKVYSNDAPTDAYDFDILRAIEDSVKLDADIINMSLGSPSGHVNASDGVHRALEAAYAAGVLPVVAAGNDGLNFSSIGTIDDSVGYFDDGTVDWPGTASSGFTVASLDNSAIAHLAGSWNDGSDHDLPYLPGIYLSDGKAHPVVDAGTGSATAMKSARVAGKFALVEGDSLDVNTQLKNAQSAGAAGIIVWNPVSTSVHMQLIDDYQGHEIFAAGIRYSDGMALKDALASGARVTATFTDQQRVTNGSLADSSPSLFSGWGTTGTLDFFPTITGVGGNVLSSADHSGNEIRSGTSMATPNISGVSAVLLEGYRERFPDLSQPEIMARIRIAIENTASIPLATNGVQAAPRQVGAGLADTRAALATDVLATVHGEPHVALREINEPRSLTLTLTNTGDDDVVYSIGKQIVLNETNNAYEDTSTFVSDETMIPNRDSVTVPAGSHATVTFTLTPDTSSTHFIEGWMVLESANAPSISVPYLGFVGDWNAEPILLPPGETMSQDFPDTTTRLVTDLFGGPSPLNDGTFAFSPNSDGVGDVLYLDAPLMRNASDIRYEILDEHGKQLAIIGESHNVSRVPLAQAIDNPSQLNLPIGPTMWEGQLWNPQTQAFESAPDGNYTYRVSARLGAGFDWQVTELPFRIDTTVPVIHIGKLVPGASGNDPSILNITVVEDGDLYAPPEAITDAGEFAMVRAGGPGAAGIVGENFQVEVPPGTRWLDLTVTDMGGSRHSLHHMFGTGVLVVDNAEAYNYGSIGIESWGVGGDELILTGTISEDIVKVTTAGAEAEIDGHRFIGNAPLVPGHNTIDIVGFDATGQVIATVTITPYYDHQPPEITITNLVDGLAELDDNDRATLTGVVTDSNPDAELTVQSAQFDWYVDESGEIVYMEPEVVAVNPDGTFTITVSLSEYGMPITLIASDGVNSTTITVPTTSSDEEPLLWNEPWLNDPECQIFGLGSCSVTSSSATFVDGVYTLTGTAVDPIGDVVVTPEPRVENGKLVQDPSISAIPDESGHFTLDIPLDSPISRFIVTMTDPDGAVRFAEPFIFFVDIDPPTLAFEKPVLIGGTLLTNRDDVLFTGTASDDGWGYSLTLNGSVVVSVLEATGAGPESNLRSFDHDVSVSDGDQITTIATDSKGNVVSGLIPVVVDKLAPQLEISVREGQALRDRTPIVTTAEDANIAHLMVNVSGPNGYTFSEEVSASLTTEKQRVEDVLSAPLPGDGSENSPVAGEDNPWADGVTMPEEPIDATGTLTGAAEPVLTHDFGTSDLADGRYTITAKSTDLAGNIVTDARTFYIGPRPIIGVPDVVDVERIAGKNRVETSVVAAKLLAETQGGLDNLVLAGFYGVPDMLSGTPLAERLNTAVVFTSQSGLSASVADLIRTAGISKVTILGGKMAVSEQVVRDLAKLGVEVERIAGADRFATSVAIAKHIATMAPKARPIRSVVLATGLDTADALVAGPLAAKHDGVVLLTKADAVPRSVRQYITDTTISRAFAVGGPAVRAADSIGLDTTDYSGSNRYATAAAIVTAEFRTAESIALAAGDAGVDAAIAGAWASAHETGVLLTSGRSVPAATVKPLSTYALIKVFGGPSVISEELVAALR